VAGHAPQPQAASPPRLGARQRQAARHPRSRTRPAVLTDGGDRPIRDAT